MGKTTWIITTDGTRKPADLKKDLASAGLNVTEVFSEIGSLKGTAEESSLARIKQVKGVVDVSPDAPVDVGPPGGQETW